MRRLASAVVLLSAVAAAACNDATDPAGNTSRQYYIDAQNNPTISTIWGAYTLLDAQFKELYERNNSLSRRGESDNLTASNANLNLQGIFYYTTTPITVSSARSALANFIKDVSGGLKSGKFSSVSANQLILRAQQIDTMLQKVQANNNTLDPSWVTPPVWGTAVSPVDFLSSTGSTTAGITLVFNDPWHYDNDPRTAAQGHDTTTVTFYLDRYDSTAVGGWVHVPLNGWTNVVQLGATSITLADPATVAPGTYTYAVQQCDNYGECSAWTNATAVILDPNSGGGGSGGGGFTCVHDNRNGFLQGNKTGKQGCPTTDKIHPNINGNGK